MVTKDGEEIGKSLALLAKGSVIVFVGVFLSKLLTYIYKFIIARNFGPESYGIFSLAIVIVTLFSTAASLGLSDGLLRYFSIYSKDFKKLKFLVRICINITLISALVATVLMFFSSEYIAETLFRDPKLTPFLKAFSFTIILTLVSNIFLSIIRAKQQIFRYTLIINVVHNLSKLLGIILLISLGFRSQAIVGSYMIGVIVMAIFAYFTVRVMLKKIYSEENLDKEKTTPIRKALFSYSWPMMFAGLIASLVYWIDSLVLGYFLDVSSVGIYGAAFTIVSLLGVAPELFMQLFLPLILKEYSKKNDNVIEEISKQISKWILILNVPIFTAMIVFPETLVSVLFGDMYLSASPALRILAIGGIFSSLTSISTNLLSMKGKSRTILFNLIIIGSINLILGVILVTKYGMTGVAWATSIVWIILFFLATFQSYYYVRIKLARRLSIRVIGLALIMGILLLFIKYYLGISAIIPSLMMLVVYSLIYFLALFAIGSLDRYDLSLVKSFLKKMKLSKI
ncbi:flippase [Candidatus Pacearchaeota archaeon]|nr:flippase [Candidatus Pacearchaeota archaeon]